MPETQGQGVGKLLISEITEIATKTGNEVLSLDVNRNNSSINFYQKIGFSKIREGNEPIGEGYIMEYYLMEKQL